MKQWWMQLQQREQHLVLAMSAFVFIFLAFHLVWKPLNQGIDKAEKKLERQQELLTYIQESAAQYQTLKRAGGGVKGVGSLSTIVNRVAKQHQINITRVQPQGDALQVWIDDVSFNQLLQWLSDLTTKQGLQVNAIDIAKGNNEGSVKVRRLQLVKG